MKKLLHPLLLLLAQATEKELVLCIEYLKAENRILRNKLPKRVNVTPAERAKLVKLGVRLGSAIKDLITIVHARTFARWVAGHTTKSKPRRPGRPRKPEEIRELIIHMARETGWGYRRILGELKKLRIRNVSRSTIARILQEYGFDPGPNRGKGSWHEFVQRHIKTLWATDFFTTKVWTLRGPVTYYVSFFIHVYTRRVHIAGTTPNPDGEWMKQQARNMSMIFDDELGEYKPTHIVRDRDSKFTAQFCSILESEGIEFRPIPPRSPNMNPGRWQKEVETFDGPTEVVLSLPDLLEPPSHQELLERGFMPDRRAHEKMFAEMEQYFADHPPESIDEMNEVMQSRFSGMPIDQMSSSPRTPLQKAQDLCYRAFESPGRRAVQLSRQALEVCCECADAYVILAEHAGTLEMELDYYAKGVAAGERAVGSETFEEQVGHFWGITSTRPYMRARLGLATTLEQAGRVDEAVNHYQELLRLNPNDNQGVRHLLLPRLLELARDVEAARFLKSSDEESAIGAYARALLAFRLSGKSTASSRELRRALQANPYAIEALLAPELPPMPDHYSPGSPEETVICASELHRAFADTPGALDWLAGEFRSRQRTATARQKEKRRKQRQKRKKRKGR